MIQCAHAIMEQRRVDTRDRPPVRFIRGSWNSKLAYRMPGAMHQVEAGHIRRRVELPERECWTVVRAGTTKGRRGSGGLVVTSDHALGTSDSDYSWSGIPPEAFGSV